MSVLRVFKSSDFMQPADGEPIRSVIKQSAEATVVAWYIKPRKRIAPHTHPNGQDTWTVLSGSGLYQLDVNETMHPISAGDVIVAHSGEVHGVINNNSEPLIFISVVCPLEAGFELI